jgi:hypothetical protein
MTLNYKKKILITNVNRSTGVLTYDFIYEPTNDILDEFEIIKKSLNIVNRVPGQGDKMYFLNGVTIPRFKIKQFHANKGSKVVKYLESSNLIIFGKTTITEYFDSKFLCLFNKNDIIKYLENWIEVNKKTENNELILNDKWATDFIEKINYCGEDVLKQWNYYDKQFLEKYSIKYYDTKTIKFIFSKNYNKLEKIVNMKCEFIDESVILKELNTNLIMNSEMYINIQRLLESSDNENVKLAMELMANCDYDSSAMYLLLLLRNYKSKIYNSSSKHHVNFKAMLNYFDYKPNSNFNFTTDSVIDKLKAKNILTKSQMDILIPLILEEYNETLRSHHYKVSMVTFLDNEGNDIVIESKLLQEPDNLILETKPLSTESSEFEDLPELDEIIYYELSEVINYCKESGLSKYRDQLLEIRALCRSSEDLLKIIQFLDSDELSEYVTLLTQCYLEMK